MKPNEVLSPEVHVPLLKEGETAVFRLAQSHSVSNRYDENGNRLPNNPIQQLAGQHTFIDPKKGAVVIGNVVEFVPKNKNGEMVLEPKCGPVEFVNSMLVCDHTKNDLYQYLMRRNDNRSNPFRDKSRRAVFYLEDKGKEIESKAADFELEDTAVLFVKSASLTDINALLENLDSKLKARVPKKSTMEEMKIALRQLIREGHSTEILKASNDRESKVKVQLKECLEWGIIKKNTEKMTWVFTKTGETLLEIEPGVPEIDALYKYFVKNTENKEKYRKMVYEELSKINK
jgi:hypothetical protein